MPTSDYAAVLQVPEWNFYKKNNLFLKFYAETVTYANLIFGIVLFVVIMKEDSVLRAHQNFYLQKFFFRPSLFTCDPNLNGIQNIPQMFLIKLTFSLLSPITFIKVL